jgi:hypothetical protein
MVDEDVDGGFTARALGESIFTEGDNLEELREMVRDAVRVRFDEEERPGVIVLRFVREETLLA